MQGFIISEEKAPRAGTTCSAGPGPNTKVIKQSNMQPSLTDDKPLHVNRPPGPTADFRGDTNAAEGRDTPYGVNKGPADGYPLPKPQEQPHPRPAEGPGQPKKLQPGPPTSRERPHPRSAEGPTTTLATPTGEPRERPQPGPAEGPGPPKKLQQRPPVAFVLSARLDHRWTRPREGSESPWQATGGPCCSFLGCSGPSAGPGWGCSRGSPVTPGSSAKA